jgi:S1-C subfamily serine protease
MLNRHDCYEIAAIYGGVPVLGALPDSPAARVGIRFGDVLLELNGRRTSTIDDVLEARTGEETTLTAKVIRNGVELTLELDMTRADHDRSLVGIMRHGVQSGAFGPEESG